jgi:GNAT superfamily N-acetyltransferase
VKKNNWHLQTLATHPDYHRNGVARALIETMIRKVCTLPSPEINFRSPEAINVEPSFFDKASQTGHLICLETQTETNVSHRFGWHNQPSNMPIMQVEIYGKLGFKVVGEPIEIKGLTGSFPFWVLVREAN